MADGTLNGYSFQAVLEPDGNGSHWLRVDQPLRHATGAEPGVVLKVALEPATEWPEPPVPADLNEALESNAAAREQWLDVTTKARWDWIRWIRSTKNPLTRQKRIGTACSMLLSGKRRPCCFNRNLCTEPAVSKNGVLLAPPYTKS